MAAAAEELAVEKTCYEDAPSLEVDRTQRGGRDDFTTEADDREERRDLAGMSFFKGVLLKDDETQIHVSTKENAVARKIPEKKSVRKKKTGSAISKVGSAVAKLASPRSGKSKSSVPRSKKSSSTSPRSGKSKSSTPRKKKSAKVRSGGSKNSLKSAGPSAKEVKQVRFYSDVLETFALQPHYEKV